MDSHRTFIRVMESREQHMKLKGGGGKTVQAVMHWVKHKTVGRAPGFVFHLQCCHNYSTVFYTLHCAVIILRGACFHVAQRLCKTR